MGEEQKPIEDKEENWMFSGQSSDGVRIYHCLERRSLIKSVYPDGEVKYEDIEAYQAVDINDLYRIHYNHLVQDVINELYPVTFPYCPKEPLRVYCDYPINIDGNGNNYFDTVAILCAISSQPEAIPINRYFKLADGKWVDITLKEYLQRKHERNHG